MEPINRTNFQLCRVALRGIRKIVDTLFEEMEKNEKQNQNEAGDKSNRGHASKHESVPCEVCD